MADQQELQVQQKREVEKGQGRCRPTRAFMPNADIFEMKMRSRSGLRDAGGRP